MQELPASLLAHGVLDLEHTNTYSLSIPGSLQRSSPAMGAVFSVVAKIFVPAFLCWLNESQSSPPEELPRHTEPAAEMQGLSSKDAILEARANLGKDFDPDNFYNYGFAGPTGSGKSALINAFQLKPNNHPGALSGARLHLNTVGYSPAVPG